MSGAKPSRVLFTKNKTNRRTIGSTRTVIGPTRRVRIKTTLVAVITTLPILMGKTIGAILTPRQTHSVKARTEARIVPITTDRIMTTEQGGITLTEILHKGLPPASTTLTAAQIFSKKPQPTSRLHKQKNARSVSSMYNYHFI